MDLTKDVPRSPFAELAGYPWLPRILDKARAHAAGTAGDYQYNCPMDAAFLEFYGLTADQVRSAWVEPGASDLDVVAKLAEFGLAHSPSSWVGSSAGIFAKGCYRAECGISTIASPRTASGW